MDFALAKLNGSLNLTKSSSTLGTIAYIAPQQTQGGDVHHRSDLFSFGVERIEMLTGKLPFRGRSSGGDILFNCSQGASFSPRLQCQSADIANNIDRSKGARNKARGRVPVASEIYRPSAQTRTETMSLYEVIGEAFLVSW